MRGDLPLTLRLLWNLVLKYYVNPLSKRGASNRPSQRGSFLVDPKNVIRGWWIDSPYGKLFPLDTNLVRRYDELVRAVLSRPCSTHTVLISLLDREASRVEWVIAPWYIQSTPSCSTTFKSLYRYVALVALSLSLSLTKQLDLLASKTNEAQNLETGFHLLEQHFGIPRLLDVEDVLSGAVDEYSIITYLSLCAKHLDKARRGGGPTNSVCTCTRLHRLLRLARLELIDPNRIESSRQTRGSRAAFR